jgi:branched-chain amino acid transport system ATP-binding protein
MKSGKIKNKSLFGKGIIYVPEGRRIFYDMTVLKNIAMGGYSRKLSKKQFSDELDAIVTIFPRLKERLSQLGGTLSGGEQQMLAIARGLMGDPKLMMLDEPSLGLAPIVVDEVFQVIVDINNWLRQYWIVWPKVLLGSTREAWVFNHTEKASKMGVLCSKRA